MFPRKVQQTPHPSPGFESETKAGLAPLKTLAAHQGVLPTRIWAAWVVGVPRFLSSLSPAEWGRACVCLFFFPAGQRRQTQSVMFCSALGAPFWRTALAFGGAAGTR
jgi:hypothetical protein